MLIAFLGGIIAPACGFMWGGNYSVIEICTLDGIESRIVENEDTPDTPRTADQCEFCFTNANLDSHFTTLSTTYKADFQANKHRFKQYIDIVLARYHSNISSRGPPALI